MIATLKKINNHIKSKYPNTEVELCKGCGYFYFSDCETESIFVCYLNQMPLEKWIEIVDSNLNENYQETTK